MFVNQPETVSKQHRLGFLWIHTSIPKHHLPLHKHTKKSVSYLSSCNLNKKTEMLKVIGGKYHRIRGLCLLDLLLEVKLLLIEMNHIAT